MPRLPQPGLDNGVWGDILNEYLSQTHKSDGTLRDNVVTNSAIAVDAVTAIQIQDGSIAEAQLDATVQAKLNAVDSGSVADSTITTAKLQDEAVTDAKVATGAAIAQSKIANLTTDLAGKAATIHTHSAIQISDATTIGRALLTATDAATARTTLALANVDNTSDSTKNSTVATLTNKTISGANNTVTNISADSLVDGITNKAFTAAEKTKLSDITTGAGVPPIRFGAAIATSGVSPTDRAYISRNLIGARMRVSSAPAGSDLSAQVQHYNGSSWSTIGTLTVSDGSAAEAVLSFSQAQTVGDLLRLNITSVGSVTAATGVAVDVIWSL